MSVAAGLFFSALVDVNGNVWVSGLNDKGQLGISGVFNDKAPIQLDFVRIPHLENIKNVYCSNEHTVLLDCEGNVWESKKKEKIALFKSEDEITSNFYKIPSICEIKQVSLSNHHMIVIDVEGRVWTSGMNQQSQLGRLTTKNSSKFELIENIPPMKSSACGLYHSLLLSTDGVVYGCGLTNRNQLIDTTSGTIFSVTLPTIQSFTILPTEFSVDKIFAAYMYSFIIDEKGTVWSRGYTMGKIFTEISEVPPITKVDAVGSDFMMLDKNGCIWSKGENHGQLGHKKKIKKFKKIDILPEIVDFALGANQSLFMDVSGSLWVCGKNDKGALGYSKFGKKLEKPKQHPESPILCTASKSSQKSARTVI